jgi:hypothetical protein
MEKLFLDKSLEKIINQLLLKKYGLNCDIITVMTDTNEPRYFVVINIDLYKSYPLFDNFDEKYSLSFTSAKFYNDLLKILKYINLTELDVLDPVIVKFNDKKAIDLLNQDLQNTLDEMISEGYDCFKEFFFKVDSSDISMLHPFIKKKLKEVYEDEYDLLSYVKTLKINTSLKRCDKPHMKLYKKMFEVNENLFHHNILEKGE